MPVVPKVFSFWEARLGGAFLTGVGFFVMVALCIAPIVAGFAGERVGLDQARWLSLVVLSAMPSFGLLTAATSMLDAYAQGKFHLPPSAAAPAAEGGAANPWRGAVVAACVVGAPVGYGVFVWISHAWPEAGMSRWSFLLWLSACAGAIVAIATYERSGRYVLREIAVPIERRRFGGSARAYLWQRHVVPQFVMNGWFNGWAGLSMVNGSIHDPASSLSRAGVLLDAGATGLLLTFGIALGTRGYVNFDLRWGVAPRLPDRAPSGLRSSLLLLAGTAGAWLALSLGMFALDIDRVHTWPLVAAHGVLLGLLCSVIAYWSARWTLSAAATQPADVAPATAANA